MAFDNTGEKHIIHFMGLPVVFFKQIFTSSHEFEQHNLKILSNSIYFKQNFEFVVEMEQTYPDFFVIFYS